MATVKVTPCTFLTPENQRSSVNPNYSRVSLSLSSIPKKPNNRLVSHSSSTHNNNPYVSPIKNDGGGSGSGRSGGSGSGGGGDGNDGDSVEPVRNGWWSDFKKGWKKGFFGPLLSPNSLVPDADTVIAAGLTGVIVWIVEVKTGCISRWRNSITLKAE